MALRGSRAAARRILGFLLPKVKSQTVRVRALLGARRKQVRALRAVAIAPALARRRLGARQKRVRALLGARQKLVQTLVLR
jgi:hypothetical protein